MAKTTTITPLAALQTADPTQRSARRPTASRAVDGAPDVQRADPSARPSRRRRRGAARDRRGRGWRDAPERAPQSPALRVRRRHMTSRTRDERCRGRCAAIDLEVAPGELVALVGPRGAGTSMLLSMIAGLEPVERGPHQEQRPARARHRRRSSRCSMQDAGLLPVARRARQRRVRAPRAAACRSFERAAIARRCLDLVSMHRYERTLGARARGRQPASGGARPRARRRIRRCS